MATYALLSSAEKGEACPHSSIFIKSAIKCEINSYIPKLSDMKRVANFLNSGIHPYFSFKLLNSLSRLQIMQLCDICEVKPSIIHSLAKINYAFYKILSIEFIYQIVGGNVVKMNRIWKALYEANQFDLCCIINYVAESKDEIVSDIICILMAME